MKEIRYTCLAVNFLEEINDEYGSNVDDLKEDLLEKFRPKVYSKSDIDKITLVVGFDLWKGMIWCDYDRWELEDWKTSGIPRIISKIPAIAKAVLAKRILRITNVFS